MCINSYKFYGSHHFKEKWYADVQHSSFTLEYTSLFDARPSNKDVGCQIYKVQHWESHNKKKQRWETVEYTRLIILKKKQSQIGQKELQPYSKYKMHNYE